MTAPWLSQLAPDRAPPPLDWWHLAPGWWGVTLLLLLALAIGVRRLVRQRRASSRWQRAAWRELARLQADPGDDATIARGVQDLLRRYAVVRHGREVVAPLSGAAWIAFVVDHGGTDWAGDTGRQLLRCAYGGTGPVPRGPHGVDHRQRWLDGARAFVKASA